jgi:hypothetical protein
MQYPFDEPFVVDSSKIVSRLGVAYTPLEQALAETAASYLPLTTRSPVASASLEVSSGNPPPATRR